jgi:hypothetical protein
MPFQEGDIKMSFFSGVVQFALEVMTGIPVGDSDEQLVAVASDGDGGADPGSIGPDGGVGTTNGGD